MPYLHLLALLLIFSNVSLAQKKSDLDFFLLHQDTLLDGKVIIKRDTHFLSSKTDSISHKIFLNQTGRAKEKIWEFDNYHLKTNQSNDFQKSVSQIVLEQNNCSILLRDFGEFKLVELERDVKGQWKEINTHELHSDPYFCAGYVRGTTEKNLISDSLYLRLHFRGYNYLDPPFTKDLSPNKPSEIYQLQPDGNFQSILHLDSNQEKIAALLIHALNKNACNKRVKANTIEFLGMLKDSIAQIYLLQNIEPIDTNRQVTFRKVMRTGKRSHYPDQYVEIYPPYYSALINNLDWNILPLMIQELERIPKERLLLSRFAHLLLNTLNNDEVLARSFVQTHIKKIKNQPDKAVLIENLDNLEVILRSRN